ncbi:hypothetical protein D3C80_2064330 [compost metagenome]
MHLLRVALGRLKMLLRMQLDPIEVIVVQGQAAQRAIAGLGQLSQSVFVETRL